MLRYVKWKTNDDWSTKMKGSLLVLFNRFLLSKGQWKGFMYSLDGLGLSKSDKLLGLKRDKSRPITLYFLKWYITYNPQGYKNSLRLVTITGDQKIL